jgi:glyoxylase-like metal-dependent hydrolase (beta-lactamase superfamily II)
MGLRRNMMETLKVGKVSLTWLTGGIVNFDGGGMFGVVPKAVWEKKYPCNERNQVRLGNDPILIQFGGNNLILETGLGNGKLTEKQMRNYGVEKESEVEACLQELGLSPADIDTVIMTHMHFDHACGLTIPEDGGYRSAFPNAQIITSKIEWDEIREPNIRTKGTYMRANWEAIAEQVVTFDEVWNFGPLKLVHTGGHSNGHCILIIEDSGETALHMADIMPTHAHQNVLWVLAFDDYPMDSISAKQKWFTYGLERNAWFTFYHDDYYRALKWNDDGEITEHIQKEN